MAILDRTFIPPQVAAAVGLDLLHQRPTTSRPKRTEPAELFFVSLHLCCGILLCPSSAVFIPFL